MGEKTSIEEVRDWHRKRQQEHAAERDGCMGRYHERREASHKEMADVIDAHIATPAQTVDIEAVREYLLAERPMFRQVSFSSKGPTREQERAYILARDKLSQAIGDKT